MVGGGREHHRVRAAAAAAGGDPVVHAARQVAQQDVVLHEAGRRLLVHQAGGRVAGVDGIAVFVGDAVLLAPVAAGHVDVALRRVGRRGGGVGGAAVARGAGVQDHRRGGCGIGLAVGAGDLGFIIDHQAALHGFGRGFRRHIRRAVAVGVDAGHIRAGHADGYAFLVRDHRIGHRRHDGQRPGVRRTRCRTIPDPCSSDSEHIRWLPCPTFRCLPPQRRSRSAPGPAPGPWIPISSCTLPPFLPGEVPRLRAHLTARTLNEPYKKESFRFFPESFLPCGVTPLCILPHPVHSALSHSYLLLRGYNPCFMSKPRRSLFCAPPESRTVSTECR